MAEPVVTCTDHLMRARCALGLATEHEVEQIAIQRNGGFINALALSVQIARRGAWARRRFEGG